MAITPARISGVVLSVSERTIKRKSDGQPFTFRDAGVLVANKGVVDVSFNLTEPMPGEGEIVDYVVEVSTYNNEPRFRHLGPFESAKSGARAS